MAAALAIAGWGCGSPAKPAAEPTAPASSPPGSGQHAWLDVGPTWFAVVAGTDRAHLDYVLDIPPGTLAQVTGYGSLTLQAALALGGIDLAASAVSGLLGVGLDGWSTVTGASAGSVAAHAPVDELPVRPAGPGASGPPYRATVTDIQDLVARHLAGVRLTGERLLGRRLEVEDASGSPSAASRAVLVLTAHGFAVTRQGSTAPGGRGTQILVYSGSAASLTTAGEVRAALGVGSIVRTTASPPASGVVVDVTVILGADLPPNASGPETSGEDWRAGRG